jgi:hypothetical protein
MIKHKQQLNDQTGDRLAKSIAGSIIKWQRLLAAVLNTPINRYSKQRQKWLLAIFCGLSACALSICLVIPSGQIAMQRQNFQPAHIGLPSDRQAKTTRSKPTDSLTTKE